jgi:hypothetical protein
MPLTLGPDSLGARVAAMDTAFVDFKEMMESVERVLDMLDRMAGCFGVHVDGGLEDKAAAVLEQLLRREHLWRLEQPKQPQSTGIGLPGCTQ